MIFMTYPPIRRQDKAIPAEQAMAILTEAEYGFLSTVGPEGAPDTVPLNHVVVDGSIYFHCAFEGRKIENMTRDGRVCFSAVRGDQLVSSGHSHTLLYESVVAHGIARRVTDFDEKKRLLLLLCEKFFPHDMPHFHDMLKSPDPVTGTDVWSIAIEHISGKANTGK